MSRVHKFLQCSNTDLGTFIVSIRKLVFNRHELPACIRVVRAVIDAEDVSVGAGVLRLPDKNSDG